MESNDTMYPATWLDKGISEWERIRCPWWLEYPLGHVPDCEETLWKGICFIPILKMSVCLLFNTFECLYFSKIWNAIRTLVNLHMSLCSEEFEMAATKAPTEFESPPQHDTPTAPTEINVNQSTIASTSKKASSTRSSGLVHERRSKRRLDPMHEAQERDAILHHHSQTAGNLTKFVLDNLVNSTYSYICFYVCQ